MKRLALAGLAAALFVALPSQAQAQTRIGPVAAFHGDYDFGIGAYFTTALPSLHENVSILADAEYWLGGENYSALTIAGGLAMRFPMAEQSFTPFAFGQLAYHNVSYDGPGSDILDDFGFDDDSSDIGLHLGGGLTFGGTEGGMAPSVGARLELAGGSSFAIFGALGFPIGGS